jgi:hypothetical protein
VRGLGLSTSTPDGRPQVVGVVVERTNGHMECQEVFRFNSDAQQDLALQLASLSSALESKLPAIHADAVVVRTLDHSPRQRRESELAVRYAAEGVLMAISRRQVDSTTRLRGKEIGDRCGRDKESAEAEAASLCGDKNKVAGAAAIAALLIAESA